MLPGSGAGPRAEGHGGSGYWKEGARQPGLKVTKSGEVPGRKSAQKEAPQVSSVAEGRWIFASKALGL